MGGHAFHWLHCPRFPPDIYQKVKRQAMAALQTVYLHVTVPAETPNKVDYGDVDFLVSSPFKPDSITTFDRYDWNNAVTTIKSALGTPHGRRGHKNPECMYFAIPYPAENSVSWIQVDVKLSFKPDMFEWETFELSYGSISKILGSMVKQLGLTLDPEGLHIRVEEIDKYNDANKDHGGTSTENSMIWVSKEPKDVMKILGLDSNVLRQGFTTQEEIYRYFASSWLFNPAHFELRLTKPEFSKRLDSHSPHWKPFIQEWIPKECPGYRLKKYANQTNDQQETELDAWYQKHRAAVRDKVFHMYPNVAATYHAKRSQHIKKEEEEHLERLIMNAIDSVEDDFKDDIEQPHIMVKPGHGERFRINEPHQSTIFKVKSKDTPILGSKQPWDIPLYYEPLKQPAEVSWKPGRPPNDMNTKAKLLCLARWTMFDPADGTPYLQPLPFEKDSATPWMDAIDAGATEEVLVKWAKEMWWHVWLRQHHTNYIGRWRSEQEDGKKKEKRAKKEQKKREEAEKKKREEENKGHADANENLGVSNIGDLVAIENMVKGMGLE